MYFVSAPAAACDDFTGITPDNAPKQSQKTDLKLVPNEPPALDGARSETHASIETDPGSLAARILQMHAASATPGQPGCRPPKLVDAQEDPALDLPGILRRRNRPGTRDGLAPQQVPQPETHKTATGPSGHGPGFKALLASTVVIAGLGGTGLYYATSGPAGSGQETLNVETQTIAAEPSIEGLIAEDAATLRGTSQAANPAASRRQIAEAKARIRRAFHAAGSVAHTSDDFSRPLGDQTAQDGKIQARLATAAADAAPTPSPHLAGTGSPQAETVIAATARARTDRSGQTGPAPQPGLTESQPAPLVAAEPNGTATAAVATSDALPETGDYPHTGTVTASVNFRASEDKDAAVLGVIPAGTKVQYDACGTWWCGIVHEGQAGFVGQKYIERPQ